MGIILIVQLVENGSHLIKESKYAERVYLGSLVALDAMLMAGSASSASVDSAPGHQEFG